MSKKKTKSTPFAALADEESFLGPNFLRKIGRGVSDWVTGEWGPRTASKAATRPLNTYSNLPSGRPTDDSEDNISAAQRQISILTDPTFRSEDRRKVARNLSDVSYETLEKAAAGSGVSFEDILGSMDQLEPKLMNKVLLGRRGLPQVGDMNKATPRETLVAEVRDIVNKDVARSENDSRPSAIDELRSQQAKIPTGENIARQAARNRPMDSFTRAEQFLEDLESTQGPFPRAARNSLMAEASEAPRATYVGAAKPRSGDTIAGTQEDFNTWRAQRTVDRAMGRTPEARRQKRVEFLRGGGRLAADGVETVVGGQQVSLDREDGQRIAVLADKGRSTPAKKSGAYAYARELKEDRRLADQQRSRESLENFAATLGEPATELGRRRAAKTQLDEEAKGYIRTVKQQLKGAEQVASAYQRGDIKLNDPREFFANLDVLRREGARLKNASAPQQMSYARSQVKANQAVRDAYGDGEDNDAGSSDISSLVERGLDKPRLMSFRPRT